MSALMTWTRNAWMPLAAAACFCVMVALMHADGVFPFALVLLCLGAALMTGSCACASRNLN